MLSDWCRCNTHLVERVLIKVLHFLNVWLDIEEPTLQCPNAVEYFAITDELSLEVEWPDPIYHDNSGVEAGRNSSHTSPAEFQIGIHEVRYQAWDPSGNMASCSILIKITG